jgi:antitoxin HigA-1
LNEHSGVSPEMALRLEKAGWSTAETWLRMQMNWNLWRVRQQAGKLRVKKFPQLEPT